MVTEVFHRLLDRHEQNPEASRLIMRIDQSAFPSVAAVEEFRDVARQLQANGGLSIRMGKRSHAHRIEAVTLVDPTPIYAFLGRVPSIATAREAIARLSDGCKPWEAPILQHIESLWAKNKSWQRLTPNEVDTLVNVQRLARVIRDGVHGTQDFRTISARCVDDSKFLERHEAVVLAYLSHEAPVQYGTLRDLMAEYGIEKIGMPIVMSGPVSVCGTAVGRIGDYIGIPAHQLSHVEITGPIEYVLTVENFVSFHRHAVEINVNDGKGLILYTGGHASHAFKTFYASLVRKLIDCPFYHWSDIDGGGLVISRTLLDINPALQPHLMTVDLLKERGRPGQVSISSSGPFAGTWLESLANALLDGAGLILEQEAVDPLSPIHRAQSVPGPCETTGLPTTEANIGFEARIG